MTESYEGHMERGVLAWVGLTLVIGCVSVPLAHPDFDGSSSQTSVLVPVDEATQDLAFLRFRDDLLAAVRRRDVSGVMRKAHERVSDRGFYHSLALGPTPKSPSQPEDVIWKALEQLLTLGGSFITDQQRLYGRGAELGDREFCAPYVYSAFPIPDPDGLGEAVAGVLLQSDVSLYVLPSASSRIVTIRSYEIVKYDTRHRNGPTAPGWMSVTTLDGTFGYVRSEVVRSVLDYHACFGHFDGKWLMTRLARDDYP
jgi:hypothetical protein